MMAFVALSILSVLFYLLASGDFFQRRVTLRTHMSDTTGMIKGSPVRLNGILVGKVSRIGLSASKDPLRIVELEMSIAEHFLAQIPQDSTTDVSADNLLGDKFVKIKKGQSAKQVEPGGELQYVPPPDVLNQADLLKSFQATLNSFDKVLDEIESGESKVGRFVKGEELYNRITFEVRQLEAQIRIASTKREMLGRFLNDDALYRQIRAPIQRVNDLLTELRASKFVKDPAAYDNVRQQIGDLRRSLEDLNAGKGTGGKLLTSDELYVRLLKQVSSISTGIDQFNSGEGTLGRLFTHAQLYESLNGQTREIQSLLKQFRNDPRKFLRVELGLF